MYGQKYSMNLCYVFCIHFSNLCVIRFEFEHIYTFNLLYMDFGVCTFIDVFDIKH